MKTLTLATVLSLSLLGGCATPPAAVPAADDPAVATSDTKPKLEIVAREERHELPADIAGLRLTNIHGDLRVRMGEAGKVGIHATIQRIGEVPLEPVITTSAADRVYTIEVHYPGDDPGKLPTDHRKGRVDIVLVVPPLLPLELRTGDGLAQARRARAAVFARTESGSIDVSGYGSLDLLSVSGRVTTRQLSGNWSTPVKIESQRGPVVAAVPAFGNVRLDVIAKGLITLPDNWTGAPEKTAEGSRFERSFGSGANLMQIRAGTDVWLIPVIPDSALSPPNQGGKSDSED